MSSDRSDTPSLDPAARAERADERLSDSPWFWLTLFGAVGLVSLFGVQGKFAQRQARLEQRYQDRLLAQQARVKAQLPPVESELPIQPGYEEEPLEPVGVSMTAARARTSLVSLQVVAGLATIAGLIGLQRRQRRLIVSPLSS